MIDLVKMIEIYLQNYVARTISDPYTTSRDNILEESIKNIVAQNIFPRIIIDSEEIHVIRDPTDLNKFKTQFPMIIENYFKAIQTNKSYAMIPIDDPVEWINPLTQAYDLWDRPQQPILNVENGEYRPNRFKECYNMDAQTYMDPGFPMYNEHVDRKIGDYPEHLTIRTDDNKERHITIDSTEECVDYMVWASTVSATQTTMSTYPRANRIRIQDLDRNGNLQDVILQPRPQRMSQPVTPLKIEI